MMFSKGVMFIYVCHHAIFISSIVGASLIYGFIIMYKVRNQKSKKYFILGIFSYICPQYA